MNELQVNTIELEPAKVVFNHEEIEKDLEKNLKKYSGLTFTEDDATECRSTIAELRKGKKAVDQYRLKIKKELNAPVTEFESKCKALDKMFDEVINPLVLQFDEFEINRRKEKQLAVQDILDNLIEEFELDHVRQEELKILDSFLTKSKSIKSVTDDLTAQAQSSKLQQDKEKSDKEMIVTTVKLANSENKLSLTESAYIRLLEFSDINRIKDQINNDVEKEVEKRNQEKKREQERIEREAKQKKMVDELSAVMVEPITEAPREPMLEPIEVIDEFTDMEDPFIPTEPVEESVFEIYKATGTESQLKALETFMDENNISWEVLEDE